MRRGKQVCVLAVPVALGVIIFWKVVLPILEDGEPIESEWEGYLPASWVQDG